MNRMLRDIFEDRHLQFHIHTTGAQTQLAMTALVGSRIFALEQKWKSTNHDIPQKI